jgi:hypothetical protein
MCYSKGNEKRLWAAELAEMKDSDPIDELLLATKRA